MVRAKKLLQARLIMPKAITEKAMAT